MQAQIPGTVKLQECAVPGELKIFRFVSSSGVVKRGNNRATEISGGGDRQKLAWKGLTVTRGG